MRRLGLVGDDTRLLALSLQLVQNESGQSRKISWQTTLTTISRAENPVQPSRLHMTLFLSWRRPQGISHTRRAKSVRHAHSLIHEFRRLKETPIILRLEHVAPVDADYAMPVIVS
jgi:hypothetical protein